jgi:hypothetical protein
MPLVLQALNSFSISLHDGGINYGEKIIGMHIPVQISKACPMISGRTLKNRCNT